MKISDLVLDLLFPKYCIGCQQEGTFICQSCFAKIKINRFSQLPVKKKYKFLNSVYAVSQFNDSVLQDLLHYYKYNFIYDLHYDISELFKKYLSQSDLANYNFDFVLPVPLSEKRQLWRGFNQVEILAHHVSQELRVKFSPRILTRNVNNRPQVGLSASQRLENVKNIYWVGELLGNKNILLIDDVTTTGATLEECAKELKKNGAKKVVGLVIAQG